MLELIPQINEVKIADLKAHNASRERASVKFICGIDSIKYSAVPTSDMIISCHRLKSLGTLDLTYCTCKVSERGFGAMAAV